jgi:hypothetical protein
VKLPTLFLLAMMVTASAGAALAATPARYDDPAP